jgi:hypothetical protein
VAEAFAPGGGQSGVVGQGVGDSNNGVVGEATSGFLPFGVWGIGGSAQFAKAGHFSGNVSVTGTLFKQGGGFRIDHPRDPESRYLNHSFVESPDMLNVYTGNVTTDADSQAEVILPDYFEELNDDYRYQLTVVGQFARAIVADEIRDSRFTIRTDQPNVKVSWQVTGIRRDPWATRNRIVVEEDKPDHERGTYLHPEVYGRPETASADHARLEALRASLPEAELPNGQTPSA